MAALHVLTSTLLVASLLASPAEARHRRRARPVDPPESVMILDYRPDPTGAGYYRSELPPAPAPRHLVPASTYYGARTTRNVDTDRASGLTFSNPTYSGVDTTNLNGLGSYEPGSGRRPATIYGSGHLGVIGW